MENVVKLKTKRDREIDEMTAAVSTFAMAVSTLGMVVVLMGRLAVLKNEAHAVTGAINRATMLIYEAYKIIRASIHDDPPGPKAA